MLFAHAPRLVVLLLISLPYYRRVNATLHSHVYLVERAQPGAFDNSTSTASSSTPSNWLLQQYSNPSEVLTILLLIGGDIVQKAIAQLVGRWTVTPAAFSFGWVSYAFMAVSSALGDGTLMPLPDIPCRVINLRTGNYRQNESWVIGRLMRDLELEFELPTEHRRPVIRILTTTGIAANPRGDKCWWSFLFFMPAQLLLAMGPLIAPRRNWTILLVTAAGSLLATLTSSIPQWRKEKFNCRTNSKETYVLTRGNGHPHIYVIQNGATYPCDPKDPKKRAGISVNLEDLAVAYPATTNSTRIAVFVLALLWVFLLVTVAGLKQDAWYLLGVGTLGTIHNIFVANHKRSPRASGVPLQRSGSNSGAGQDGRDNAQRDVRGYACVEIGHPSDNPSLSCMDVLKLAEERYAGLGIPLVKTFFPGDMDEEENKYWQHQRETLTERRQGLKKALESKTKQLTAPPIRRRPGRTSSSMSWRGFTRKYSHRQEADPERGPTASAKPGTKESVQRKSTDGSVSTVTRDGVARQDFGQQKTGSRTTVIEQGTPQSPISSSSPRRSDESSFSPIDEVNERDTSAGAEEYFSEYGPQSLYPIISAPEPAELSVVEGDGSRQKTTSTAISASITQRTGAMRAQSYTGAPNRYPRSSRPSAFRTQTGYSGPAAEPNTGLTQRARTFTFPTTGI